MTPLVYYVIFYLISRFLLFVYLGWIWDPYDLEVQKSIVSAIIIFVMPVVAEALIPFMILGFCFLFVLSIPFFLGRLLAKPFDKAKVIFN